MLLGQLGLHDEQYSDTQHFDTQHKSKKGGSLYDIMEQHALKTQTIV
jgi:hypothetical protein